MIARILDLNGKGILVEAEAAEFPAVRRDRTDYYGAVRSFFAGVEELLPEVLSAAARPHFGQLWSQTRTGAIDDVAGATPSRFVDSPAAHWIARDRAGDTGERSHVGRGLQEFLIVELPCRKHAGAGDAFANYRYKFVVVSRVPQPGNREVGALPSTAVDPVTRRA